MLFKLKTDVVVHSVHFGHEEDNGHSDECDHWQSPREGEPKELKER